MFSLDGFAQRWKIDPAPLKPVADKYPFGLNPYFEEAHPKRRGCCMETGSTGYIGRDFGPVGS